MEEARELDYALHQNQFKPCLKELLTSMSKIREFLIKNIAGSSWRFGFCEDFYEWAKPYKHVTDVDARSIVCTKAEARDVTDYFNNYRKDHEKQKREEFNDPFAFMMMLPELIMEELGQRSKKRNKTLALRERQTIALESIALSLSSKVEGSQSDEESESEDEKYLNSNPVFEDVPATKIKGVVRFGHSMKEYNNPCNDNTLQWRKMLLLPNKQPKA